MVVLCSSSFLISLFKGLTHVFCVKINVSLLVVLLILFLNACTFEGLVPENSIVRPELSNSLLHDKIWLGVPTPFEIKHTDQEEYFIEEIDTETKQIIKRGKNQYSILIKKSGEYSITILNAANEIVSVRHIKTKYLPNLIPSFCEETGNTIRRKQLIYCLENNQGIKVTSMNYDVDITYRVKQFELVTFDKTGQVIVTKAKSEYFNEEQINQLLNLKIGDRFYIEKIIVERQDKSEQELKIMRFELQ